MPDAPAFTWQEGEIDGVECMVNYTGYTGERGVELMTMADDASELWDRVVARGADPCGLGARDTLRLEACFALHGNDIGPDTDAISAGLGWTCALGKEFTGVEQLRAVKEQGRSAASRRSSWTRRRFRARGWRSPRAARSPRHALADARDRHRHGLRAGRSRRARLGDHDRRSRHPPPRPRRDQADLQARGGTRAMAAAESYPEELRYHPEHDWARIEDGEATSGSPGSRRTRSASSSTSRRPKRAPPP